MTRRSLIAGAVTLLTVGCAQRPAGRAVSAPVPPAPATGADLVTPEVATTLREAIQLATAASQRQELAATISYLEQAEAIAPGHPAIVEQLAKYRLRAGDQEGALAELERLAQVGSSRPIAQDTAYAALFAHPRFTRIAGTMADVAGVKVSGDTAFTVREADLLVEGITHHEASDGDIHFYLGSMTGGRVLRVAASRGAEPAVTVLRTDGRVLGLRHDGRGRLWVNVWKPALVPPDSAHPRSTSSLQVHDSRTGSLIRRFDSPADGTPHLFNDIALGVGRNVGQAWITDSDAGRVYHADLATGALTPVIADAADVSYPNGITLSPDGERLYVAHVEGISIWDLSRRTRTRLGHERNLTLTGIDGLYSCGAGLVAVQRVGGLERISWFRLTRDGQRVESAEVLEQGHPAYAQPTTGTLVGSSLYYVATSELRRHLPDGTIAPAVAPSRTLVLRVPLWNRCR